MKNSDIPLTAQALAGARTLLRALSREFPSVAYGLLLPDRRVCLSRGKVKPHVPECSLSPTPSIRGCPQLGGHIEARRSILTHTYLSGHSVLFVAPVGRQRGHLGAYVGAVHSVVEQLGTHLAGPEPPVALAALAGRPVARARLSVGSSRA